jgi:hypothetical protein
MPAGMGTWYGFSSDYRKKLTASLNFNFSKAWYNSGNNFEISTKLTYKPVNTLSITLKPAYSVSFDELQYVDQNNYLNQNRYIFASIDQKVLSMSLRANLNLTPDLSVEYWGQPFIASGKYYDFKYITDPMASEYHDRFHTYTGSEITYVNDPGNDSYYRINENGNSTGSYTIGKPDFNVREFLSNLVIRWEYNPGSSIYLVWSQSRSGNDSAGILEVSDNMHDLFNIKPHNVFLVKFSYRFGLK